MEESKDASWLEKESLCLNVNHFPSTLSHSHRSSEIPLAQGEQHSLEESINDKTTSSRRGKPSHWLLNKKKLSGKATEPQRRKSRGTDKLHPPDGNYMATGGPSDFDCRPATSSLPKTWSVLPMPLPHSTPNSQGSLTQSAQGPESSTNRNSTTVSPQTPDLDGSSKFSMHTPLCLLHHRDSLSPPGNFDFSVGASVNVTSLQNSLSSLSLDSPSPSGFQTRFTLNSPASSTLYNQLPFALLAVYALQNLNSSMSNTTVSQSASSEEARKPQADQEKLKQLQESLLAEDSGEEGDRCRICQIAGGSPTNALLEPCGCVGSLQFVHEKCLKKWLETKIKSGADLGAVKTCELCKQTLKLDLDDFNVNEYYRNHHYLEAENELTDLYLVLLFHVWDLMRQNYNPTSRNRVRKIRKTTLLP
uniref:RING-type E3 ubiquitin transferase n=1 Tax=Nothoprocta perdicaria TaxID=30464 RepID=A0A8C6ZBI0_NOTPE